MITFIASPTDLALPDSFRRNAFQQNGFTLLEMVLVLFLIGLLASAGLLFTEGVEDQAKYDETKRRMELIRKAIVGDPSRTINGAPEISGFAADMGRLPGCIAELLTPGEMSGVPADNAFISPCSDSEDMEVKGWQISAETGLGYGWRGPYLQTQLDRDGKARFRDGYGNDDETEDFGWQWKIVDGEVPPVELDVADVKRAVSASLKSLGFDAFDDLDDIPQGEQIPFLVKGDDWQITSLDVVFKNISDDALPDTENDLLLRVYTARLTDYIDGSPLDSNYLTLAASSVLPGDSRAATFTFAESEAIAQGVRAYAVVCHENPPVDPDDFVIFNGDCETASERPDSSTIRKFSAIPRNSVNLQLDWIIPIP